MTFSSSSQCWNLQLVGWAKYSRNCRRRVCAAAFMNDSLGFICDSAGVLQVWMTAPNCTITLLESVKTPHDSVPLELLACQDRNAVLAVFPEFTSRRRTHRKRRPGGEVHAYIWHGKLQHLPTLETAHGVISAACIDARTCGGEILLASESRICSHSIRWRGDSAVRLPMRLQIVFSAALEVKRLRAYEGTLTAITKFGSLYTWRSESGSLLCRTHCMTKSSVVDSVDFSGRMIAARLSSATGDVSATSTTRIWQLDDNYVPSNLAFDLPLVSCGVMFFEQTQERAVERRLYVVDEEGTMRVWLIHEGATSARLACACCLPHLASTSAAIVTRRPNGDVKLVACTMDGIVIATVHHPDSPKIVVRGDFTRCEVDESSAEAFVVGPSSCAIFSAEGSSFRVKRRRKVTADHGDIGALAASSVSGSSLAVGYCDGHIVKFSKATLQATVSFSGGSRVSSVWYHTATSVVWAGFVDGTVVGFRSPTAMIRLPPHAAEVLLIGALAADPSAIAILSADGELRIWRVPLSNEECLQLLQHAELCFRRPSALILPPRSKGQELAVGTADSGLEIWGPLLLTPLRSPIHVSQRRVHARAITAIATAHKINSAVALLTLSKDCAARWLLDDGLWPIERFVLARPPTSVGLIPLPCREQFCVVAVCAGALIALASRTNEDLLSVRESTIDQALMPIDDVVHPPPAPSGACVIVVQDSDSSPLLDDVAPVSRAVVVGGRLLSARPPQKQLSDTHSGVGPKHETKSAKGERLPLRVTTFGCSSDRELRTAPLGLFANHSLSNVPDPSLSTSQVIDEAAGTPNPEGQQTLPRPSSEDEAAMTALPSVSLEKGHVNSSSSNNSTSKGRTSPALPGTNAFQRLARSEQPVCSSGSPTRGFHHSRSREGTHPNLPTPWRVDWHVNVAHKLPSIDDHSSGLVLKQNSVPWHNCFDHHKQSMSSGQILAESASLEIMTSLAPFRTDDTYKLERERNSKHVLGNETPVAADSMTAMTKDVHRQRFYTDRRTLQISTSAPGSGICSKPAATACKETEFRFSAKSERKLKTSTQFLPLMPSHIFAVPYWQCRNYDELLCDTGQDAPFTSLLLATATRRRQHTVQSDVAAFDDSEFKTIISELDLLKQQERRMMELKPIRGVRGYGFGTCVPNSEDNNAFLRARRQRIRVLESLAEAELWKQRRCSEGAHESDAYMKWLRMMREANTVGEALEHGGDAPSDETEKFMSQLANEGQRGLYRAFRQVLGEEARKVGTEWVISFSRLASWQPVVYAMEELGIDRKELKAMWRRAHRNRHGADRGNFLNFVEFAIALERRIDTLDVGPCLGAIRAVRCDSTSVDICAEFASHSRAIDSELALVRAADGRNGRRLVRLRLLVVPQRSLVGPPEYYDFFSASNERATTAVDAYADKAACCTKDNLEPDTDYVVFALCHGCSDFPVLAEKQLAKINKRIATSCLEVRTQRGQAGDNDDLIEIPWALLTPEQQRTELLAALKSREVCAAARERGMDIPEQTDARISVQNNDAAAAARWKAWSEWWPNSGMVRKQFMRREMIFAAKQSVELRDMARAAGAPIDMAEILSAQNDSLDDPHSRKRWLNFQRWYCGMPVIAESATSQYNVYDISDKQVGYVRANAPSSSTAKHLPVLANGETRLSHATAGLVSCSQSRVAGHSADQPSRRLPTSQAKLAAQRIELKPASAFSQRTIDSAILADKRHDAPASIETKQELPLDNHDSVRVEEDDMIGQEDSRSLLHEKVSTLNQRKTDSDPGQNFEVAKSTDKMPNPGTSRLQSAQIFDLEAAQARMAMRNSFLNARTSKVSELRERLENSKLKKDRKRPLKAYVKMIMFQLRMQKTLGAGKAGSEQLDTEIDIFAELDEAALVKQIAQHQEETRSESIETHESKDVPKFPEPPQWLSMALEAQDHELQLACVEPIVLDYAVEAGVSIPDPEDWLSSSSDCRCRRLEKFGRWYSNNNDDLAHRARAARFVDEVTEAATDADVSAKARSAGVQALLDENDVVTISFGNWYATATASRAKFLMRRAGRLLSARRALAVSRQFLAMPPILLLCPPPLARLAREPPEPRRYLLYPSRTQETWSVAEILHWYDDDIDCDRIRKAIFDPLDKWRREDWLRREAERQHISRLEMAWEDDRAHLLRAAQVEMLAVDDAARAHSTAKEACRADLVIAQVRQERESVDVSPASAPVMHREKDLIFGTHLWSWDFTSQIEGWRYVLGTGLDNGDELDDSREMKRLATEDLAREHELKMKRREEERRIREEEERKQREYEERRRQIEQTANERQRIIKKLDAVRARKAIKASLAQAKTDEQRRIESLRVDRDRVKAVLAIAMAREKCKEQIECSILEASSEQKGNTGNQDDTISSQDSNADSDDDNSKANVRRNNAACLNAVENQPNMPIDKVIEENIRHYRAISQDFEQQAQEVEQLLDGRAHAKLRPRSFNANVMPFGESLLRDQLRCPDFVLTNGETSAANIVELLRTRRVANAAQRLGLQESPDMTRMPLPLSKDPQKASKRYFVPSPETSNEAETPNLFPSYNASVIRDAVEATKQRVVMARVERLREFHLASQKMPYYRQQYQAINVKGAHIQPDSTPPSERYTKTALQSKSLQFNSSRSDSLLLRLDDISGLQQLGGAHLQRRCYKVGSSTQSPLR